MHELWSAVRKGRHTVVVGSLPPLPEVPAGEPGWVVVRIGCDARWSTWGPIEGARRRIESVLGEQSPRWDEALDRMGTSTRLLGDLPEPTIEATLVGAANRLADQHPERAVLVIEALEAADEATIEALRDIVQRPGWLRLPLVLCTKERPTEGALAQLVADVGGEPLACAGATEGGDGFDWSSLPAEQLLVMRAAAVVGRVFEAELVSRLLGVSVDAVLLRLQQAADLGVPLADQGGGRFFIPEEGQRTLLKRVLPSLVERWHRRLGELLAEPTLPTMDTDVVDEARPAAEAEPTPTTATTEAETDVPETESPSSTRARGDGTASEVWTSAEPPVDESPRGETPPEVVPTVAEAVSSAAATPGGAAANERRGYSELLEPTAEPRLRSEASEPAPAAREPSVRRDVDTSTTVRLTPEEQERLMSGRPRSEDARDQARAAHHLSEAGLTGRAVEQYLVALRKVAASGDSHRALMIAEQALRVLEREPPSRARSFTQARVLSMAARVQWRGAGRGPALTLQGALETLDEAETLLGDDAPLDLRTEIAQLVAGVCYDLGDIGSLQRALDALTRAARELMAAGESTRAARLLNDQAAVYLRAGDPVRANHLLQQSRQIFDELHRTKPDDPTVIVERAETEHLLARLPLHARLRSGREDDAYSLALGHARAAAEGYRKLGGRVELGRVSETMGRLETARGRHDRAIEHIDAALRISKQLGDLTGLARGTAALAELYIAAERPAEALAALRDSVGFNVDKGSPLGLSVDRRILERLRETIASKSVPPPGLVHAVAELDEALHHAERMLGRVSVPDEVD